MADGSARRARIERLLEAARELADGESASGRALRARLRATTALSSAGIERALGHALETHPSEAEVQALLAATPEAPRAHVLLSANVFVAALRAIALGVASSKSVAVRASRRDPALAEALFALVPDLFELTPRLTPAAGERMWSYGSDATLAEVRRSLPPGVWFHPHGAGFGAVVVAAAAWAPETARAIALDTALFDQQGCLSPRLVCVVGSEAQARSIAGQLAEQLRALDAELPPGPKNEDELAAARRQRDAAAYAFELFDAGSGWISCSTRPVLPPGQRTLHVVPTSDAVSTLSPFTSHLTCIAAGAPALSRELCRHFPGARVVAVGEMQRPPFDGPVDHRKSPKGELIG